MQTLTELIINQISYQTPKSAKYNQLKGLLKQVILFGNAKISILSYKFILDFQKHIESSELSQNTKFAYWNCFKRILETAYNLELTKKDLSPLIKSLKQEDVIKEVMTDSEVALLFDFTPPMEKNLLDRLELLKDMAKISLYSGLRFSDIQNIDFAQDISQLGANLVIRIIQQKTRKVNTVHLHSSLAYLLEKYKDNNKPFIGLDYHDTQYVLKQWVCILDKTVTFHTFRHTFAMKLYSSGIDILTVSQLLGHKNINTTQNYVKCLDSNKSSAILNLQY